MLIVNGGTVIEDKVFFGSNSTVRENITIDSGLIVSAGSIIL